MGEDDLAKWNADYPWVTINQISDVKVGYRLSGEGWEGEVHSMSQGVPQVLWCVGGALTFDSPDGPFPLVSPTDMKWRMTPKGKTWFDMGPMRRRRLSPIHALDALIKARK